MSVNSVLLNKGELINLIAILKNKYGDLKLSDLQNKITHDDDLDKLVIYPTFLGKKVKIHSKKEGLIQRIKKKGEKI
ncbi:hypothetical protein HYS72_03160 [Candidatus Pacearchaeota archaeon]|nr:hypothetical protein [Candidatus Pacearchaeota archaeon]MBI2056630.1 hypothetical protein [Candidatus Pacearchaeota archaeon]